MQCSSTNEDFASLSHYSQTPVWRRQKNSKVLRSSILYYNEISGKYHTVQNKNLRLYHNEMPLCIFSRNQRFILGTIFIWDFGLMSYISEDDIVQRHWIKANIVGFFCLHSLWRLFLLSTSQLWSGILCLNFLKLATEWPCFSNRHFNWREDGVPRTTLNRSI